jgi:hypothetical protein
MKSFSDMVHRLHTLEKWNKEQSDKIEFLTGALSAIYCWYPTDITNPHNQVNKMREVAYLALNGDYRQYVENHYAALKEGE